MSDKPRILIICNTFLPTISGVGQYIYNITRLLKNRYDFVVLTSDASSRYSWRSIIRLQTYLKVYGVEIVPIRLLPPYFPYLLTFPLAMEARRRIKKKLVDIVHSHSFGQIHSDISLIFAKKSGLPTAYTIHGWKNIETSFVRPLLSAYESTIAPRVLRSADVITVLGKRGAQYVQSLLKSQGRNRIEIVPNGVDFRRVRNIVENTRNKNFWKNMEIPDNRKILIYAGRLTKMKGLIDLILAFRQVHKSNKDSFLLIIGDGPLKNSLVTLINNYGLRGSCKIVAQTTNYNLLRYLANAHIFVLPSYAEGMPTVLLEAMAAEVPVIATNVGDIEDIVIHKETGLIVQPGNIQQLANSILEVLDSEKLRRKLARNSLEIAKLHDWFLIAEKVGRIYERLAAK